MAEKIYYNVEKIKKSSQGRTFYIASSRNTRFEMLVSEEQYERFDIDEGDVIDDEYFLKIREEMLFDNARRHAFAILSSGENNKRSLVSKLHKKGFAYDLCDKIALYMENRGYINEKKQIGLLCDTFLKKKFGKIKIINELVTRGYKREEVSEFAKTELENVDFAGNCAYIIEHKYVPFPSDKEELRKMMGALMRYGYTVSDIKEAIHRITERRKNES